MISRRLLTWWAGLLAVLGGCSLTFLGGMGGCAGVYAPPPHPTVKLSAARLTSKTVLSPGEDVSATALANMPPGAGTVELMVYAQVRCSHCGRLHSRMEASVRMHDDGEDGDLIAGDGEWYGACTWPGRQDCELQPAIVLSFSNYQYSRQFLDLPKVRIVAGAAAPEAGQPTAPQPQPEEQSP